MCAWDAFDCISHDTFIATARVQLAVSDRPGPTHFAMHTTKAPPIRLL